MQYRILDRYPSMFWENSLKSDIETTAKEKKLLETYEPDETQIIVSINA